jgi:hypothetical protein
MNADWTLARRQVRTNLCASVVVLVVLFGGGDVWAEVDTTVPGFEYHAQITSYYCGSATIQMMLDNDAVRQSNPYVDWILNPANAPDPEPASFYNPNTGQDHTFRTIPFNAVNNIGQSIHPTIQPRVIPGVNNGNAVNAVTYGPQLALYDFGHGAGTYTPVAGPNAGVPLGYFNPFQPWGAGTGINSQQVTLNVFDNPNVGGEGNHVYAAYNVPTRNVANRTIANAIITYQVPAGGVFYAGAHAMAISGVQTDVAPVKNQPYKILGFYVHDPWYGYARKRGLPEEKWGLPENTFLSTVLKDGQDSRWEGIFNSSPGEPLEGAYAEGPGFKFVVEPEGPELLDDGSNSSDTAPVPMLANPLTSIQALTLAQQLLTDSEGLSSKYGLSGGGFDGNNVTFIGTGGTSDWLVPYLRAGDYTGAFLINSKYGILEAANWLDVGDVVYGLSSLVKQYEGINGGFFPNDNPTNLPEAGTLTMIAIAALLVSVRRRRRFPHSG